MALRTPVVVTLSLAAGVVLGAGTVIGLESTVFRAPPRVAREPSGAAPHVEPPEDEPWEAANASLVASLAECNRRLRDAGQRQVAAPAPAEPAPAPSREPRARAAYRERAPLTKDDWERHAEAGTVPYRIPCLRDTPYTPSARDLDRLGLAPDDAAVIRDAYAESNKRVAEQVTPVCAAVLGGEEAARRIGPSACMKAIEDASRRGDPARFKEALTHVAEIQAGKREASRADASPVERLMLGLTAESRAFEADLAKRLGPEDAARIANARGMCEDRGVASVEQGARAFTGRRRRD